MPKATDDQKALIGRLVEQGHTHKYIAEQLGWSNKTAERSVARVVKELREAAVDLEVPPELIAAIETKTLDEMTRDQRVIFLKKRINETPRFKFVFQAFSAEEQVVFIDEYVNLVSATDSLTEAEEQTLFASIGEYILAYRALRFKSREERWYEDSIEGIITAETDDGETDPRYRRINDSEKYQKQYDGHMKLYQKGIEQLKMSRVQRMKEVRSDRKSLVDVIETFSHKNAQADATEAIVRLSLLRDDELKDMLENGYIYGIFED
jgi:hypothetical protein